MSAATATSGLSPAPATSPCACWSPKVVTLATSGVILYFWYRPAGAIGATGGAVDSVADVVRFLHRIVAFATVPTAVAAAVLLVLPWTPNRQTHDVGAGPAPWVGPAAGAGLVLAALAGLFTGGLLP